MSKTLRHWCRSVLGPKCLRSEAQFCGPKCLYTLADTVYTDRRQQLARDRVIHVDFNLGSCWTMVIPVVNSISRSISKGCMLFTVCQLHSTGYFKLRQILLHQSAVSCPRRHTRPPSRRCTVLIRFLQTTCITTNWPHTISNPNPNRNPNPTTKQHEIVTCRKYPCREINTRQCCFTDFTTFRRHCHTVPPIHHSAYRDHA